MFGEEEAAVDKKQVVEKDKKVAAEAKPNTPNETAEAVDELEEDEDGVNKPNVW